jgi:glutathione synthase/RimK-type ligase-like ATP-grasp enzyme
LNLRIATCLQLPEPDPDAEPLAAALGAAGINAPLVAWDDPAADWDAPIPTLIRSTWNYPHDAEGFLAWVDRAGRAASLFNPPDVVRGNVHKRYLLALAARGVPVVPTTLVPRGGASAGSVDALSAAGRVVIKPEVGAGSLGTRTFRLPTERDAAEAHLAALTAVGEGKKGGAALIQPYLASVEDHGERSLVWIDGALSHAIRKAPRFTGDAEAITGPFPIADDERDVAEQALAPLADRILYGRVDLARDDAGRPLVMELELIEPSLFFAQGEGAVERLVAGLARRLGGDHG